MKNEITDYERDIIELVFQFGGLIGLSRSVCAIYGILFCSIEPASMEEISSRLKLSIGSTSQGLKLLRGLGAVRTVYVPGERKEHYQAEFNFREIVSKYLNDEIRPQILGTSLCLDRIESDLNVIPSEKLLIIKERLGIIRKLDKRLNQIIPAISKILSL